MGRRPADWNPDPDLHRAIRWLRDRADLTQAEAALRTSGAMSLSYLRQCERAARTPSRAALAALLAALGTDQAELDGLLLSRPWEGRAPSPRRPGPPVRADRTRHAPSPRPPGVRARGMPSGALRSAGAWAGPAEFTPGNTLSSLAAPAPFQAPDPGSQALAANVSYLACSPPPWGDPPADVAPPAPAIGLPLAAEAPPQPASSSSVEPPDVALARALAALGELREVAPHLPSEPLAQLAGRLEAEVSSARRDDPRRTGRR